MPCLFAIIALGFPRLIILILALFTQYMTGAYNTLGWPLLGFFFAPYTTLAYAVAMNENGGAVSGWYLALVIIAVLFDIGAIGGGGRSVRRRKCD